MKTFITCVLVFFLVIFRPVYGKSETITANTSLTEYDSVKIFKLLMEARAFASQRDYEKAVESALKAASLSEQDNYEYGKYRSYKSLELLYKDAGKLLVSAKYKLKAMNSQSRLEAINYERDERERLEKIEKERHIREQQKQLQLEQEELQFKMDEIARLEREKKLSKSELDKRKYEIARKQVEIDNKKQTIDIQRETINSTFDQLSLTLEELETQRLHAKIYDDSLKLVKRNEEVLKISDEKQKLINYLYIIGLSGFIILAAFIYRMYAVKSGVQDLLVKENKEIAAERKKIDDLLLNILPLKVADELKRTGKYEPRNFEKATVVIVNLINFAKVNELMTSAGFVEELDIIYKAFDEITERNNLERIRAFSDSYICVSGIPVVSDYNPMNNVRAAIEMQSFLKNLENNRKSKNQPFFEFVIAIHTGSVTAGIIGSKFTFDIWGGTVMITSEIGNNSESGQVITTADTYDEIKDKVDCLLKGKYPVRNVGDIDLYYLKSIKESA